MGALHSTAILNPTVTPTRAGCRGEGQRPLRVADWITASRARRVLYLLAAIWILNAFDLALTIRAHADGMLYEDNPLARLILPHGPTAVFVFKVGIVAFGSFVMYTYRNIRFTECCAAFVMVAYLAVALQWKMCYQVYDQTFTSEPPGTRLAQYDVLAACLGIF